MKTTHNPEHRGKEKIFYYKSNISHVFLYIPFENGSSIELNTVLTTLLYACRLFISFTCIIVGELREMYYLCPIVRVRDVEF